jgi:hypothetical protein
MTIALRDRLTHCGDIIETGTTAGASKAARTITHSSRSRSLSNFDFASATAKLVAAAGQKRTPIGRQLWTQFDVKIERVS